MNQQRLQRPRASALLRTQALQTGRLQYWSPNYIQHKSHIKPGRDGLFNLVKSLPAGSKWEHGIICRRDGLVPVQ